MSGGSLSYFYEDLEEHVGDFGDEELDDLVADLSKLFHDREWYLSSDTGPGDWEQARENFKRKWFTEAGRKERIEQYMDDLKDRVLKSFGLSDKYCVNCAHFHPDEDGPYGSCSETRHCLMHERDACRKFARRGDPGAGTGVFFLPIRVKIVANDANGVVRAVSETIYDSVQKTIERAIADGSCDHFDLDFSIHRKMTDDEFEHPTRRNRTAYIPGKQAGGRKDE